MKKKVILFATSHPIQYQVPLFKKITKKNRSFEVIYEQQFSKNVVVKDIDFKTNIHWGSNFAKGYNFYVFSKKKKNNIKHT